MACLATAFCPTSAGAAVVLETPVPLDRLDQCNASLSNNRREDIDINLIFATRMASIRLVQRGHGTSCKVLVLMVAGEV